MVTRSPLAQRAWLLIIFAAAVTHAAIGATFFVSDNNLLGPVFTRASSIPDTVWGLWAILSGALIIPQKTRLAALVATAAWYALWGAFLIFGVIANNGPMYAVPVYIFLIVLHLAFALTEWAEHHA